MFKFLLRDNEIDLADYDLTELDQTFIEEIINGTDECERKGRERSKFYLYGGCLCTCVFVCLPRVCMLMCLYV